MKNKVEDHRSRVTKLLIREAFLDMLQKEPIQSISVKALCEAAGIHRGTFYTHYQDVYDLLAQIEEEMLGELTLALEPMANSPRDDPRYLVDVCTGIFQCMKENADICVVMLGDFSDTAFVARLLALGKESCLRAYAGYFDTASSQDIEYFYAFVSAGCIGLLRHWIEEGMNASSAELARMAEAIMLRGINFLHGEQRD